MYTIIKSNFTYNIKKENFIGFLEVLSDTIGGNDKDKINNTEKIHNLNNNIEKNNNTKEIEEIKNFKYIYISLKSLDNYPIKYKFYNKKYENYMTLYINNSNIEIYDIDNKIIGKKINNKYNNYVFSLNMFNNKNINFELYNYYNNVKIYLDNADKYFYLKNMDFDKYDIYLFSKKIGKIIYKDDLNSYKVIILEDYKIYINLFAIAFILIKSHN
jgi:hypothetical protein